MSNQSDRLVWARCEGLRVVVETDLTPRLPFHIDTGWYDAHWYGAKADAEPGCGRRALRWVSHGLVAPAAAAMFGGIADVLIPIGRRAMASVKAPVGPDAGV
jgi:hypothetical protein